MESCHLAAARRMKLWSLNANLFFKEQRCNCNLFGLTDTVVLFAKEDGFFSDLGYSSGQVLSKTKSVTPNFFTFLKSLTHHLSMVKFAEKNQC